MVLGQKLRRLSAVFDLKAIAASSTDAKAIKEYYRVNKTAYSLIHDGSYIHMGITRSGRWKRSDLKEAARTVLDYVKPGMRVLELACGRGANTAYLAEHQPSAKYFAIDFSSDQLKHARKLRQCTVRNADYHALPFPSRSFDLVFIVEALCYSKRKDQVLLEAHRVLKRGGVLIILDGYREPANSASERFAQEIVSRGMAVENFTQYATFRKLCRKAGFTIMTEEDVSLCILPTLRRFERFARLYLSVPPLTRFLNKRLPRLFTANFAAAYLFPDIITSGLASYWITVLRK